jgi:hypothetical protein
VVKLGGDKVKGIPQWLKAIIRLMVLVFAVVALYEFVYNFIVWNSLITADAMRGVMRFDDLSVEYPNPESPWNLVFATKMTLAAFLISAHCFYTISKPDKKSD